MLKEIFVNPRHGAGARARRTAIEPSQGRGPEGLPWSAWPTLEGNKRQKDDVRFDRLGD